MKVFRKVTATLIRQKIVKLVYQEAPQQSEGSSEQKDAKPSKAFQLLQPTSEGEPGVEGGVEGGDEEEEEEGGEEEVEGGGGWPMVAELPLDIQGYRQILSSGPKGMPTSVS